MKIIIVILLMITISSCRGIKREPISVCDNSIPEGIVVYYNSINSTDDYILNIRTNNGVVKILVDESVVTYLHKNDTIIHC